MKAMELNGIDIRTESGRMVHSIEEYISEAGTLEFEGEQYTPIGMTYVGEEYVANMRMRHEDIPRTIYQDAFCHTDEVITECLDDEVEVPRYKLTITDGVVVDAEVYDYDNVRFLKSFE